MKVCEQCCEEYAAGTGATEWTTRPSRFTERFCSESCAAEYEEDYKGGDQP